MGRYDILLGKKPDPAKVKEAEKEAQDSAAKARDKKAEAQRLYESSNQRHTVGLNGTIIGGIGLSQTPISSNITFSDGIQQVTMSHSNGQLLLSGGQSTTHHMAVVTKGYVDSYVDNRIFLLEEKREIAFKKRMTVIGIIAFAIIPFIAIIFLMGYR